MAKGKYGYWILEEGITLMQGWARDGLTDEQIAHNMGINVATLYGWKNKYSKIDNALKKGKAVVDYEVENALCQRALAGDVTAQIFWLKNRRPDKWRDKQIYENTDALDKLDSILAEVKADAAKQ